jgi:hypothetical protein
MIRARADRGWDVLAQHMSSSVAGASTITFAATRMPRSANRNGAPAHRCCNGSVTGVGAVDYPGVGAVSGGGGFSCTAIDFSVAEDPECNCIVLEKNFGQTGVVGQRMLDEPAWYWPD